MRTQCGEKTYGKKVKQLEHALAGKKIVVGLPGGEWGEVLSGKDAVKQALMEVHEARDAGHDWERVPGSDPASEKKRLQLAWVDNVAEYECKGCGTRKWREIPRWWIPHMYAASIPKIGALGGILPGKWSELPANQRKFIKETLHA